MSTQPVFSDRVVPMLTESPFDLDSGSEPVTWTAEDRDFLEQQEKVIKGGFQVFLEVGTALAAIHDYKGGLLYLEKYDTFKNYCEERWGLSTQHVYRKIAAAKLLNRLSPRGDIPQETKDQLTERHLRELNRIPDEDDCAKLLNAAVAQGVGSFPSSREIEKQVNRLLEKPTAGNPPIVAKAEGAPTSQIKLLTRDSASAQLDVEAGREVVASTSSRGDAAGMQGNQIGARAIPAPREAANQGTTRHGASETITPLIGDEYLQAALDEIDEREDLSPKQQKLTRQFVEELVVKLNELVGHEPDDDIRTSAGCALECVVNLVENP